MKKILLLILLILPLYVNASGEIGIPAKGGFPEYLFLEKVNEAEAKSTAEMITKALALGRLVIFAQMGKLTDPLTGKTERNLAQASHTIDTLDMLRIKCRGNLSPDEDAFLTHVISELKLNYVDECNRPEPKPESGEEKKDKVESKNGSPAAEVSTTSVETN